MEEKNFIAYEYKSLKTNKQLLNSKIDIYKNLGYEVSVENSAVYNSCVLNLKRDRKIAHKNELLKLEKKIEVLMNENEGYVKKRDRSGLIFSITFGIIGLLTFGGGLSLSMVLGSVISYIFGAIIQIIGGTIMVLNYFIFNKIKIASYNKLDPIIVQYEDKIAILCENAYDLQNSNVI